MDNPNGELRRALPGRFTDKHKLMPCMDCGLDTHGEYYLVRHELWLVAVPEKKGYLCIECLERRLDRRLTPDDFMAAGANDLEWRKTPRLLERMVTEQSRQ